VNATERAALLTGYELFDELASAVDERTLEILDRRRTTIVKRRGWLVRRMLPVARPRRGTAGGAATAVATDLILSARRSTWHRTRMRAAEASG
jgi:hypothetical protein